MGISQPEALTALHNTQFFDCGEEVLDHWLIKKALKNEKNGASRTLVVCDDNRVAGYYALASGSIERQNAAKAIARNMPDPIPVIVLGRLAVDQNYQGLRIGSGLLKDAMKRTVLLSQHVGVKALMVHALSEDAKAFYHQYGFQESPMESMTLMLGVNKIIQNL